MTQRLRAIYEDGVFRPLEPVELAEHQAVILEVEEATEVLPDAQSEHKPIWEVAVDLASEVPEAELDVLPSDGAAQHDHYLYGAPKRE